MTAPTTGPPCRQTAPDWLLSRPASWLRSRPGWQPRKDAEPDRVGRRDDPPAGSHCGEYRILSNACPGRTHDRFGKAVSTFGDHALRFKVTATGQWSEAFGRSQPARGYRSTSWPGGNTVR